MRAIELLERAAAQEQPIFANRPKSDLGPLERRNVQGMNALGRGQLVHMAQVLL
jgi:hypothetical protein